MTDTQHAERISLDAAAQRGHLSGGQIETFDDHELAGLFEGCDLPLVAMGEELDLTILGAGTPGEFLARAINAITVPEGVRYTFTSVCGKSFREAVFRNRRDAVRVTPAAGQPIKVLILPEQGRGGWRGNVHDLSRTGLSFSISDADEEHVMGHSDLRLRLRLPEDSSAIEARGIVKIRTWTPGSVRYGVAFAGDEDELEALQDRLGSYLMTRQVQLAREAREAEGE